MKKSIIFALINFCCPIFGMETFKDELYNHALTALENADGPTFELCVKASPSTKQQILLITQAYYFRFNIEPEDESLKNNCDDLSKRIAELSISIYSKDQKPLITLLNKTFQEKLQKKIVDKYSLPRWIHPYNTSTTPQEKTLYKESILALLREGKNSRTLALKMNDIFAKGPLQMHKNIEQLKELSK